MEKIEKIWNKIKTSKLLQIEIGVIIFCLFFGTILHFLYEWTGGNAFIGSFSAVNESVWEHLKLSFYPMLIAAIVEYFFVKEIANNYIEAKTIGIFASICFTTVAFFTYTGIIGTNFLLIDILIFIFSIVIGEWIAYKIMKKDEQSIQITKILSGIIIGFLLICFIVCTYCPPEVNFFRDYETGNYGIEK